MTTPEHIGKYEDLHLIGQGRFGNVYRAPDPDLRCEVALKVMNAEFAGDEQWGANFRQEARLMARVVIYIAGMPARSLRSILPRISSVLLPLTITPISPSLISGPLPHLVNSTRSRSSAFMLRW